jgi:5-methylcytosine-specific restriction enzyme A
MRTLPRLKTLSSLVQPLAPRLGHAAGDERGRNRIRETSQPWRAWYHSTRWQQLRLEVFARDEWNCQRSGVIVVGKAPAPDSPVAHHRIPHHGDPRLFWDVNNVETIAKAVHDELIQAEERAAERLDLP